MATKNTAKNAAPARSAAAVASVYTGGGAAGARSAAVAAHASMAGSAASQCEECGVGGHVTILDVTEVADSDWEGQSRERLPANPTSTTVQAAVGLR